VPCYRGFNTFWYGDIWLIIENFLSRYNYISRIRKFYFTDNPNNFSNDINNKENIISIDILEDNWAKNIMVNKTADLIANRTSSNPNYINSYRWDNTTTTDIHATYVGGDAANGSNCGLASLDYKFSVDLKGSNVAFVKCYILN
jgi:hypothetical protein